MGFYIGGYDPLKLIEGILNKLIQKGVLTEQEAQLIIDEASVKPNRQGEENESKQK